jgi:hypothetical protein
MRARRLQEQGGPALQAAVEAKLVSAYRAGEIAKLPAREQELAVLQWANRSLRRVRGHVIAADVIRKKLRNPKIDLA